MDIGFRCYLVKTSYCVKCGKCFAINLRRNAPLLFNEKGSFSVFGKSRATTIHLPSRTWKRQNSNNANNSEPHSHINKKLKERLSCIK
jgi:hypothetical protein